MHGNMNVKLEAYFTQLTHIQSISVYKKVRG